MSQNEMKLPKISLAGKNGATLVIIIVGIALMVLAKWLGGWCVVLGVLIILGAILANSIIQIEGGTAGAQKVFGAPVRRVLKPGWRWIVPFFTEVKFITTKHLPHEGAALDVETNDGFKIGIEYKILRGFIPELVWHFVDDIEEPFDENYLDVWLREIFQNLVRTHSSKEIQEQPAIALALQDEIKTRFYDEVNDRMFKVCGQTIVSNIQLVFGNYVYAPKFLELQESLRDANNRVLIAEQNKKAQITEAEAVKESTIIVKTGDAEGTKLIGAAENAVLKRKGEILERHSSISENEVAKHYPQVVGGVMPTLSIKEMLNSGSTTSSTPTPPTP